MNCNRIAVCVLFLGAFGSRADDEVPTPVRSVAFSPDGKILVAAGGGKDRPGTLAAWDAETHKPLWRRDGPTPFGSISFAPDGKSFAVANGKTTALRVDPTTGRDLGEVGPHPKPVRSCLHLPGTDLLAIGSDGTINLWNLKTNKLEKELKGHPGEVTRLIASPDSKWLISSGPGGTRGWDVAAGTELKAVKPESRIGWYGIVFAGPDRVLYADNSATQYLIELPSGKELTRYKWYGSGTVLSPKLGLAANTWHSPEISVMDLTFRTPTKEESARMKALLKDFDDDSFETRTAASKAMKEVGSMAEPRLRQAAAESPSAEVRMRAREARKAILEQPLRVLKGHTADVWTMSFSPDGRTLASGSDDGTIRLWDPLTGRERARLELTATR